MQYGEEGYKLGFRGTIEAIDVIYSNDVPAGVAYLISTDPLSYPTGQYTPVGWFIESRPITNVNWDRPDLDSYMVYSTHMYTTCIGYGEGIVQLTYMSYS